MITTDEQWKHEAQAALARYEAEQEQRGRELEAGRRTRALTRLRAVLNELGVAPEAVTNGPEFEAAVTMEDVPGMFVPYVTIDGVEFTVRGGTSEYQRLARLAVAARCPKCGERVVGHEILTLVDLGRELADHGALAAHDCGLPAEERLTPELSPSPVAVPETAGERLLAELINVIDERVANWQEALS